MDFTSPVMQPAEKNTAPETPTEKSAMDTHVGARLRMRRLMLGLTQEKLADMLGITFQQIQKYERGLNKLGASRLYELANLLRVPMTYFFEAAPGTAPAVPGMGESGQDVLEDAPPAFDPTSRETVELLRAYYRIEDDTKRRRILDLIRAMRDDE